MLKGCYGHNRRLSCLAQFDHSIYDRCLMSTPATVGVGLVGCGFAATFHAEAYRRVHGIDVRLQAVCSRQRDKAQVFAQQHGIPSIHGDLDQLLADDQVDLVDVCVPNRFHEETVIAALQSGKRVSVEKPFTGSFDPARNADDWHRCLDEALASADRIRKAEYESGNPLMYAENWCYSPGVQKAKRLLAAADTPILRMVGEESHSGTHSNYAVQWQYSGGGALNNKGCHLIGAAVYLKYEEGLRRLGKRIRPQWVTGIVGHLTRSEAFTSKSDHVIRTGWEECEDWGTAILGFDDGTVAQISGADTVVGGIQNILSIYAARACIHVNLNPNDALLAYSPTDAEFADEYIREKVETKAGWQFSNPDEDWMNGFPNEAQDFCEVVATGREPMIGSFLARDVTAVVYAGYLSAALGRRVDVPIDEE